MVGEYPREYFNYDICQIHSFHSGMELSVSQVHPFVGRSWSWATSTTSSWSSSSSSFYRRRDHRGERERQYWDIKRQPRSLSMAGSARNGTTRNRLACLDASQATLRSVPSESISQADEKRWVINLYVSPFEHISPCLINGCHLWNFPSATGTQ